MIPESFGMFWGICKLLDQCDLRLVLMEAWEYTYKVLAFLHDDNVPVETLNDKIPQTSYTIVARRILACNSHKLGGSYAHFVFELNKESSGCVQTDSLM
jgi:hypothetical protein